MIRPDRGFTVACLRKKLESMGPYEPDLMLTNCPGCRQMLDQEQWAVNELTGSNFQIPVLSYAELAGLLLGWDPYDVVGIQGHDGAGRAALRSDRHPSEHTARVSAGRCADHGRKE